MKQSQPLYGGQAVMEGVFMRGNSHWAVAVRRKDGGIEIDQGLISTSPNWYQGIPVLRGIFALGGALRLGMGAMLWSARIRARQEGIEMGKASLTGSIVMGAIFAVLLAIAIPFATTHLIQSNPQNPWFLLWEGLIRILVVLVYLKLISLLPDVRRVFQYHGAEHKVINAYEHGMPLEVEFARQASRLHPRCGTGFVILLLVVTGIVYALIALMGLPFLLTGLLRLAVLPLILGVGFEIIRLFGRQSQNPWFRPLIWPLLASQHLTTGEPTDSQLEISLVSFKNMLNAELADVA